MQELAGLHLSEEIRQRVDTASVDQGRIPTDPDAFAACYDTDEGGWVLVEPTDEGGY